MLVVGQNMGTNTTKDKATVKHLFAMDASKVSDATRALYSDLSYLNACGQDKMSFRKWDMNLLRLSL